MEKNQDRYAQMIKVGPKGQIVIPKEWRDIFQIQPGDTILVLADKEQGIAIPTKEKSEQLMTLIFSGVKHE